MRFLADMGISIVVCEALRAKHDVLHLRDQGLHRLGDEQVLAKAAAEERILLTHDLDMGRLLALAGARAPSLITVRLSNMTSASVIPHLWETLRLFAPDLEKGAAVSVTDRTIRCHRLPLSRKK